MLQVMKLFKYH